MKLTRDQAHSLANQISNEASIKLNAEYEAKIKAAEPAAKKEAKKIMLYINKLPEWIKRDLSFGGSWNKINEKRIVDKIIENKGFIKKEVRRDIYDQVVTLSIDCKSVDEIKRGVKAY